jgi:hypothetical protein
MAGDEAVAVDFRKCRRRGRTDGSSSSTSPGFSAFSSPALSAPVSGSGAKCSDVSEPRSMPTMPHI